MLILRYWQHVNGLGCIIVYYLRKYPKAAESERKFPLIYLNQVKATRNAINNIKLLAKPAVSTRGCNKRPPRKTPFRK